MTSVPVLSWSSVVGNQHNAQVLCDSTLDTTWNVTLAGTNPSGQVVFPKTVIIDNMGNNSTVYFTYGLARYQVAPYTRKTIYLLRDQLYIIFTTTLGVLTLTFCDFDPNLPEEVNGVATNTSAAAAGSSSLYTTLDPTNKAVAGSLSNGNLTYSATANSWQTARGISAKSTGKFYFEAYVVSGGYCIFGVGNASLSLAVNAYVGSTANSYGYQSGQILYNGAGTAGYPAYTTGGYAGIAVDIALLRMWVRAGASAWNSDATANPTTGVNGINISGITAPLYAAYATFGSAVITANFGTTPFQIAIPSGYTGWTQ